MTTSCLSCGKPLQRLGSKPKTYCDSRCRANYLHNRDGWERRSLECPYCKDTFLPKDRRQKVCSNCSSKGVSNHIYTCKRCGKEYQAKSKSRDKYCSRACAFADIGAWRRDDSPKAICLMCGGEFYKSYGFGGYQYCSAECRDAGMTRRCEICQQDFIAAGVGGRLCSDECRAEDMRRRSRAIEIDNHRKKAKTCKCRACGVLFSPLYATKKRAFCSETCAKRQARRDGRGGCNNAQRAKRLGLTRKYFNERKILERDGWACYLCGQPTPPELRGTYEPNAPELDHIVPLSKGGAHIKENVACICRRCNGEKGNRTLGEMGLTERVSVTQTRLQF